MRRGDILTVIAPGAFGKPRPAIVIQSDGLESVSSVLVVLLTSNRRVAPLYRMDIGPTPENGLLQPSQVMIDKIIALPIEKIGKPVGRLSDAETLVLNRMLAFAIGVAD